MRQNRVLHLTIVLLLITSISSATTLSSPPILSKINHLSCLELLIPLLPSHLKRVPYETQTGNFREINKEDGRNLLKHFEEFKKGDQKLEQNLKRVRVDQLQYNLQKMSEEEYRALYQKGMKKMGKLAIFTSGAGLWSRGGGVVKALLPYNISELLGTRALQFKKIGDLFSAEKMEEVTSIGQEINLAYLKNRDATAQEYKEAAKKELAYLLDQIEYNPKAITPLDVKFINVAINSKRSGSYITFDVITSPHTHLKIYNYIEWFRKSFRTKQFHQDPNINQGIHDLLHEYFNQSKLLGENHLIGQSEGVHAIDPVLNEFINESETKDMGAGTIYKLIHETDRIAKLQALGKSTALFENIEISSDYPPLVEAFLESKRSVGVVLVPQQDGYKGGNPFWVEEREHPGSFKIELHEMSMVPEELRNDNELFNSNTVLFNLNVKPIKEIGFEYKEQMSEARVKINAGDITHTNSTMAIGGRIGQNQKMVEYENFKTNREFADNGAWYLSLFQNSWPWQLQGIY